MCPHVPLPAKLTFPPPPSMALTMPVCAGVDVSGSSHRSSSHVCSRPLKSPVASRRSAESVTTTSKLLIYITLLMLLPGPTSARGCLKSPPAAQLNLQPARAAGAATAGMTDVRLLNL